MRLLRTGKEHLVSDNEYFFKIVQDVLSNLENAMNFNPIVTGEKTQKNIARLRCILKEAREVLGETKET